MSPQPSGLPLDDLEGAHEHAEVLLTRYAGMLSAQLSALLSEWHTDLTMLIEDRYDLMPDDDAEQDPELF
jgi:hypothetical protein